MLCDSNFDELPVGAVCVADVQLKGRGSTAYLMIIQTS